MTIDLLDRPLGDLTLREIATIARAAQSFAATMNGHPIESVAGSNGHGTLPAPAPLAAPAALAPPPGARRTTEEIRRDRAARDTAAIDAVRQQVAREGEAKQAIGGPEAGRRSPGKGRKLCPNPHCNLVVGASTRECSCGHIFAAAR